MLMFVLIFLGALDEIISTFLQFGTGLCLARNLRPSRMVKRGDGVEFRIFEDGEFGGKGAPKFMHLIYQIVLSSYFC